MGEIGVDVKIGIVEWGNGTVSLTGDGATTESTESLGITLLTMGNGVNTDCGAGDGGNGGSTAATGAGG